MIRRSDEKVEYSDEPDPLYTRGDLLKYVQELQGVEMSDSKEIEFNRDALVDKTNTLIDEVERLREEWERSREMI